MPDVQKLNLLLAELGHRYGITNLKLSTQGAVGLRLKDGVELFLEQDSEQGRLYVYTPILSLPKANDARLRMFARMLELNFLGSSMAHGILSVQRNMAICHVSIAIADLKIDTLDQWLHYLLESRATLVNKLKTCMRANTSEALHARHSASALLAVLR
ncbi:type III secretion system chaperone [Herbaspirillum sp. GCM10030257]|uniref:type III secretion system chaperone n=1 Tax=Herbaspirillum sp. GCM10030257 TaxID=3273393 RepID=UPI0036085889